MLQLFSPDDNNIIPLNIDAWKILSNDKIEFIKISLKKGEEIEKHINDVDVYFFVIIGKVKFIVNEDEIEVEKDSILFIPKGINRSCINTHNKKTELLVVKLID